LSKLLDPDQLMSIIQKNRKVVPVKVEIYNFEWLKDKQEFKDFYYFLAINDDKNLFHNAFVNSLLIEQKYTTQIWWVFALYILKLGLIWYYYFIIFQD